MNIMRALVGKDGFTLSAKLSGTVETVTFKAEDGYLVSMLELVNQEEHIDKTFELKIKTGNMPVKVIRLPDESELEFEYVDGYTIVKGVTENFTMLKIVC